LEEIASQTGGDPALMAPVAAERGLWKPALELEKEASAKKERKVKFTEDHAKVLGRLAVGVRNDQEYQQILGDFEAVDPQAANKLRQAFPTWTPEAARAIQMIGQQGMSAYEREHLRVQSDIARNKAEDKDTPKLTAGEANSMRASILAKMNVPFTTDAQGNSQFSALDPDKASKLRLAEMRAAQYKLNGIDVMTAPNLAYDDVVSGRYTGTEPLGGSPAPGGKRPPPKAERDAALRMWQDPAKRPQVKAIMEKHGYDMSFLPGEGIPAVAIPSATVKPSSAPVESPSALNAARNVLKQDQTSPGYTGSW
jgi:hypothetical protein